MKIIKKMKKQVIKELLKEKIQKEFNKKLNKKYMKVKLHRILKHLKIVSQIKKSWKITKLKKTLNI